MKRSIKILAAKEVIVFFSSAALVGIIYLGFWLKSGYCQRRVTKLEIEFGKIRATEDSIQLTINNSRQFESYFTIKGVSKIELNKLVSISSSELPTPKEVNGTDLEKECLRNIRKLYVILQKVNYDFNHGGKFGKYDVPEFANFLNSVWSEAMDSTGTVQEEELYRIFSFLKRNKNLEIDKGNFHLVLQGFVPTITSEFSDALRAMEKEKELKLKEIKYANEGILYSNDLWNILYWTIVIVLIVVYPLRILLLLFFWALRTLKESNSKN